MNIKHLKPTTIYRDFQIEAIKHMLAEKKTLIALPTGTGKALTSLSISAHLKENYYTIFVSEKSILHQTAKEVDKFFTDITSQVIFENTPKQRQAIYEDFANYDILFTNYHTIRNDLADFEMLVRTYPVLIIYDEATAFKNRNSKLSKAIQSLSKHCDYVYALTATPSKGKLEDIYNILWGIGKKPMTVKDFVKFHCIVEPQYFLSVSVNEKRIGTLMGKQIGDTVVYVGSLVKHGLKVLKLIQLSKRGQLEVINESTGAIRYIVPRLIANGVRDAVAATVQLFDKTRDVRLNLSTFTTEEMTGYKNIKRFVEVTKNLMFIRSKKSIAKELPPFTVSRRDFIMDQDTRKRFIDLYTEYENTALPYSKAIIASSLSKNKDAELLRMIDSTSEKFIVYSSYTTVTDHIEELLRNNNIDYATITGKTKDREKERLRFVETDCQVIVITSAAIQGINLQIANNIICYDLPILAGDFFQLVGRISRIGTTHSNLNIIILENINTIDTDMYNLVFGQIKFIQSINPELVDEGLIDDTIEAVDTENADKYIKSRLKNRKAQFLKG